MKLFRVKNETMERPAFIRDISEEQLKFYLELKNFNLNDPSLSITEIRTLEQLLKDCSTDFEIKDFEI